MRHMTNHITSPHLRPCTQVLDDGLDKAGVPYAYGFSIIALTVLVKLATFPLSQKQVRCGGGPGARGSGGQAPIPSALGLMWARGHAWPSSDARATGCTVG